MKLNKKVSSFLLLLFIAFVIVIYRNSGYDEEEKEYHAIKGTLLYPIMLYYEENQKMASNLSDLIPKYVKKIEKDPWGNEYFLDTKEYNVYSAGKDGIKHTKDDLSYKNMK